MNVNKTKLAEKKLKVGLTVRDMIATESQMSRYHLIIGLKMIFFKNF